MPELDPQMVAELLARPKGSQYLNTLGSSKGKGFLEGHLKPALIGDPNATVNVPMDEGGRPMNMNMVPSQFHGTYGVDHPAIDAGVSGGMLATGAPELMTRSLMGPLASGFKAAAARAPLATTGATAAAATSLPSTTGKTPWETMMEQWEQRRGVLNQQIQDQNSTIERENKKFESSPADQKLLEKLQNDVNPLKQRLEAMKAQGRAGPGFPSSVRLEGQIKAIDDQIKGYRGGVDPEVIKKQIAPIIDPARAAIEKARGGLGDIDKEIQSAQTPVRQATYPWSLGAFPAAWAAAGLTGYGIGKVAKLGQGTKLDELTNIINRSRQHITDTTTKATGAAKKSQFTNTEGAALKQELEAAKGRAYSPALARGLATGTGAAVGGAEGLMVPGGFNAIDAQVAPGGSPLSEASGWNALKSPVWWRSVAPEIGMGALAGAIGGYKGSGGMPSLTGPQRELNSLAFSSRNLPVWPTAAPRAPRVTAPKAVEASAPKAVAAPAPKKGGGRKKAATPLDDIPDL